jgi:A/G-specific adenine glycosylase
VAVRALIEWFATAARILPWRATLDPYAIWVSEIMLQQTQVKTVIPYWERWMQLFPTPAALAAAEESVVLKAWEGLGYYSRARNLQKAARQISQRPSGEFPTSRDELLELPGIGPYTAGAIASIAFNQPAPILDGNVIRVLTRVHALRGNPVERELNKRLWSLAQEWVQHAAECTRFPRPPFALSGSCSALNQSLMELGATLCTPRSPGCPDCPIRSQCAAHRSGNPEAFPETAPRPVVTKLRRVVVLIEHRDSILVRQRPEGGINAGYWEFPELELEPSESGADAVATAARWSGLELDQFSVRPGLVHSITRYRIQLEVLHARVTRKPAIRSSKEDPTLTWIPKRKLAALHLTAAHRKLALRLEPH